MACCVFAFLLSFFLLLCSSFYPFAYLLGLCLCCPLACLVCSCVLVGFVCVVVSFSLSDYTQKERALRVGASSLVVLCVFRCLCSY